MTCPTQPEASHFIDGRYREDASGEPFDVIYLATGEVIATLHAATPVAIEAAITSARSAQKGWAKMSRTERGRILRRAAGIMRKRNHDLSVLETLDTGKPDQETSVAEGARLVMGGRRLNRNGSYREPTVFVRMGDLEAPF